MSPLHLSACISSRFWDNVFVRTRVLLEYTCTCTYVRVRTRVPWYSSTYSSTRYGGLSVVLTILREWVWATQYWRCWQYGNIKSLIIRDNNIKKPCSIKQRATESCDNFALCWMAYQQYEQFVYQWYSSTYRLTVVPFFLVWHPQPSKQTEDFWKLKTFFCCGIIIAI